MITPLKNASWPATLEGEIQYSLFTVSGTEVLGKYWLRAVSRSDIYKFYVMTLKQMALPPALHLLVPPQRKCGHSGKLF